MVPHRIMPLFVAAGGGAELRKAVRCRGVDLPAAGARRRQGERAGVQGQVPAGTANGEREGRWLPNEAL